MATITTSHILSFVLKAQVGPGALKQGLPKGQGVAQLLAAPKGAGPPGLAAHHPAGCEKNWPALDLQGRMASCALLLASRHLCMKLNPPSNPFELDPTPLCNENRSCPEPRALWSRVVRNSSWDRRRAGSGSHESLVIQELALGDP